MPATARSRSSRARTGGSATAARRWTCASKGTSAACEAQTRRNDDCCRRWMQTTRLQNAAQWLLLPCALAMPAIAFLSRRGLLGPENNTVSDCYPTLLIAAGYAFSIWGLIFLLDVIYAA